MVNKYNEVKNSEVVADAAAQLSKQYSDEEMIQMGVIAFFELALKISTPSLKYIINLIQQEIDKREHGNECIYTNR